MKIILLLISFVIFAAGCDKPVEKTKAKVNIAGEFSGIIPCADCEGIYYLLTFNPDTTYSEKMIYIGKEAPPLENKGKWSYTDTNKIKLTNKEGAATFLEVTNGNLIMLNAEGKKFDGPVADKFILKPGLVKMPERPVTDSSQTSLNTINGKWTLQELNGKKTNEKNYMKGLPFLDIRKADNKFSGSTGCNTINGASTIVGNEVVFTKYITTRMACPGTGESDFISALAQIKSYKAEKNILLLMADGKTVLKFSR